jgi:prophage regulatory protein
MNDEILRERDVRAITKLGRTTRWRLERLGQFPRRRQIGANSVGWLRSEIAEWITECRYADCKNSRTCQQDVVPRTNGEGQS